MMMIVVQYDEGDMRTWHVWYVSRYDRNEIMNILSSHATYCHGDRSSNKRTRTADTRQICDGNVLSIIVLKNDRKSLVNKFFDHHQDQKQVEELNHHKSKTTTFDDIRRRTQVEESMIIANVPLTTNIQAHNEGVL